HVGACDAPFWPMFALPQTCRTSGTRTYVIRHVPWRSAAGSESRATRTVSDAVPWWMVRDAGEPYRSTVVPTRPGGSPVRAVGSVPDQGVTSGIAWGRPWAPRRGVSA